MNKMLDAMFKAGIITADDKKRIEKEAENNERRDAGRSAAGGDRSPGRGEGQPEKESTVVSR